MFLMFHKLFRNMFEQIIINDMELKQLKQVLSKTN
jgi:glycerol-3-phosphate O-acyltransferase